MSEQNQNLAQTIKQRLRSMKDRNDRKTLTGLAKDLGRLPSDKSRVALEIAANLAGVSLRASKEFLQAARDAAEILSPDDLRSWGELGRKLAMTNADTGVKYFADGVENFREIPEQSRTLVFQVCLRQLVLSSAVAVETFHLAPEIAASVKDEDSLNKIFGVAAEIAKRSAKHSADFLKNTVKLVAAIEDFGAERFDVLREAARLANIFAVRTGGMAADLWAILPEALKGLSSENAKKLLKGASNFLDYGGSVTLHFVAAGGEGLRRIDMSFDAWCSVADAIAKNGNATLAAFLRSSSQFFNLMAGAKHKNLSSLTNRVLRLTQEVAAIDAESALACFRSSAKALRQVSVGQFEDWIREGLKTDKFETARARRSYFALETRRSFDRLHEGAEGLPLESVQGTLRMYVEGLTGRAIEIQAISAVMNESKINDGKTIYLPANVSEFGDDDLDFRLYKVLAAHAAGQIEFGTHEKDTAGLKAAYSSLSQLYEASAMETDAFSLAGYIEDVKSGESALPEAEEIKQAKAAKKRLPKNSDYKIVLEVFPQTPLARKIFTTLENGRIDRRLRIEYKGLRRDLDLMQSQIKASRPNIMELPISKVPFELLFQIALCGGANDDTKRFFAQIVVELETVVAEYLNGEKSTVADTLMATSRIYELFQSVNPEQQQQPEDSTETDKQDETDEQNENSIDNEVESEHAEQKAKKLQDAKDLFNAWNDLDDEGETEELNATEAWTASDVPEQQLETGEIAFAYDEWDRELNDFRLGWCRVIEKRSRRGDRSFVELARERHKGVISSIRHQFQLMKPENLTRIHNELDGEDYDLNAVVEFIVDKRSAKNSASNINERLYTKKLRKQRDVAVSFLLDQSSSTARTIARNPLQPYTHPGRRIIEIEKDSLVLMSEALEAVGDVYSIYGFTSEGRRNVKFYVVKDFQEKYNEEIEKRIGGITFQNNTRLGAAIRHAGAKLLKQDARTKLMIILTDGRPYDHDYGDAKYAREDVREALKDAKLNGITPFCVTIDRDSESELKDLYGDVGYTIIDDVLSLPERMPNIYRRLTS